VVNATTARRSGSGRPFHSPPSQGDDSRRGSSRPARVGRTARR
jgi:hypothetical protein